MNITLEKYSKEYEKIVADYVGNFFGYHSKLSGFEKLPAIEQSLENIIQWTSEKHALYVILLEKRSVGFIHIWYKGDNVAWIEDLYIEENHRRQVFLLIGTKSEHWVKTDTDQMGFRKSHYGSDSVMTFSMRRELTVCLLDFFLFLW